MSLEDNKHLVREYIEKVINTGNVEIIDKYISEDYTEIFEGKKYLLGIKGAKEHIKGVRETYNNLCLTINKQIAENEYVVTCITAKGSHNGIWMDIKPTGKLVTFTGVNVDKILNGKIVEHSGASNLLHSLLDIGAIKIVRDK
jgi:predicted ester cyclase